MINNNTDGITVVHGNSVISPIGPFDTKTDLATGPIVFRTSYINNLPNEVIVIERSGLRHRIPNIPAIYNKSFIIRTEIYIRYEAYKDMEKLFACIDEDQDQDLKTIRDAYYIHVQNKMFKGMTIVIDNIVSYENIKASNGHLYYSNKDIVISTLSLLDAPGHPYNSKSVSTKNFEGLDEESNVSMNIEIIDNSGTLGVRYVMLVKELHTLIPRKDHVKTNGIYVTTLEKDLSTKTKKKLLQTRYNFENCEETLGIYKTKEECLSAGDVKTARKEELTKLEHEYSLIKINLDKEIQELKNSNLSLEKEKAKSDYESKIYEQERKDEFLKIKHEYELKELLAKQEASEYDKKQQLEITELNIKTKYLEAEMERKRADMKDYYESRSYVRKDSSELLKYLPTIITGCLAVATIFVKYKLDTTK